MKFSCFQENLSKGLNIVGRAISVKAPLPILSNILIQTEENKIKLAATNLETTIITHIEASVSQDGGITVPAKLFRDFITGLSPSTIEAHTEDEILHVKSDKTKSRFNGIDAEEFPELPDIPSGKKFIELDPQIFDVIISLVAFASGTDDSRPIFTGVLLDYKDNYITFASTDGFRLSEKNLNLKSKMEDFNIVVPAKALVEVAKIFSASEEPIKFGLNESQNKAHFFAGDTFVSTSVLDGQYPDYQKIIPTDTVLSATFPTEEFLEAVRLTNVFAKEGNNAIKIRFDPEGYIKISSLAEETGEHESEISAEIEGDIIEIAFSSKYLLDYLNNVKTEKILFSTNGNISPCVLKSEENEDFVHIIMPMQL